MVLTLLIVSEARSTCMLLIIGGFPQHQQSVLHRRSLVVNLMVHTYFLFLKMQLKARQTMENITPAAANMQITTTRGMNAVAMSSVGTPSKGIPSITFDVRVCVYLCVCVHACVMFIFVSLCVCILSLRKLTNVIIQKQYGSSSLVHAPLHAAGSQSCRCLGYASCHVNVHMHTKCYSIVCSFCVQPPF